MWYKRRERQYRISLFFSAASLAGAFGGILAYVCIFFTIIQKDSVANSDIGNRKNERYCLGERVALDFYLGS